MTRTFLLNSMLLGAGLSMDAVTVSLADGLNEPSMSRRRMCAVAGTYGAFQAFMPLAGRGLVRLAAARFTWLQARIPFVGAALLLLLGADMLRESFQNPDTRPLDGGTLLAQGLATSVDALSAGFAVAAYELPLALTACAIIAAVTFCDCLIALRVGKKFGLLFARQASLCGGVLLLAIGAAAMRRVL